MPCGQMLPHQTTPPSFFPRHTPQSAPKSGHLHYARFDLHRRADPHSSLFLGACGFFLPCAHGNDPVSYRYLYIFFQTHRHASWLPALGLAVASILTQQTSISGMNPAVNAVQVFRQILPSEATNQKGKSACRLGLSVRFGSADNSLAFGNSFPALCGMNGGSPHGRGRA